MIHKSFLLLLLPPRHPPAKKIASDLCVHTTDRVTGRVCRKKIAQNVSKLRFIQSECITFTVEKSGQKHLSYFSNFRKIVHSKHSQIGRKFAPSGHPDNRPARSLVDLPTIDPIFSLSAVHWKQILLEN
jgi:hypothetical protein